MCKIGTANGFTEPWMQEQTRTLKVTAQKQHFLSTPLSAEPKQAENFPYMANAAHRSEVWRLQCLVKHCDYVLTDSLHQVGSLPP